MIDKSSTSRLVDRWIRVQKQYDWFGNFWPIFLLVEVVSLIFYPDVRGLLGAVNNVTRQVVATVFLLCGPFSIASALMDHALFDLQIDSSSKI